MTAVQLVAPVGPNKQQRPPIDPLTNEGQQLTRRGIRPLQILQDYDARAISRIRGEDVKERLEQPALLDAGVDFSDGFS